MNQDGAPNSEIDRDFEQARSGKTGVRLRGAAFGLTIANLGTYPGREFLANDPQVRANEFVVMRRTIDLGRFLGARSIRVSPGRGESPALVDALVPPFRQAATHAEKRRIYLGMENHQGRIAGLPDACMELVRQVDSPFFGVLYEPANLMQCGVDYRKAHETFRGAGVHVHVKDSRVRDGQYKRTMLGEGDVDIEWLVRRSRAVT